MCILKNLPSSAASNPLFQLANKPDETPSKAKEERREGETLPSSCA